MASQKLENLLNLSLAVSPQERERSLELPVGVEQDRWELIVKYHGDLRGSAAGDKYIPGGLP